MRAVLANFRSFVLRGNIIDLAIAVVVGTAFTAVVTALVKNVVTPLIAAIFGQPDFNNLVWTLNSSRIEYGAFLNALISFLLIATVVYFGLVAPLAALARLRSRRLGEGEEEDDTAPTQADVPALLVQIRDLLSDGRRDTVG